MSSKHQPGLFQKTTEKARVLSQEPYFKMERVYSSLRMSISIFKVRIIRVVFVRKSGRVEQLYILLTELGSYVGLSITSGET